MLTAFSTALSGLHANEVGVDLVGNNLANLNTPGYKASVASFSDLMSQSLGAGTSQVGMGTGAVRTIRQFTQGAVQTTGGAMDAAISGDGFFVVREDNGNYAYTRAGQFTLDSSGNLIAPGGQLVQGWTGVNGVVNTGGTTGNIAIPSTGLNKPTATSTLSMDLNLNAAAADKSTFSTPVQVVDSLGATHVVTLNFTKTGSNNWSYTATIPGEDVTAGKAGTPYDLGITGTLTFGGATPGTSGQLTSPAAGASGTIALKIPGLANGAEDMKIDWSLYNPDGSAHVTQYAASSAASATQQNGTAAGVLTGVSIADGGKVVAKYSNGEDLVVAQLAVASIRNPDTLTAVGDNMLEAGPNTSAAVLGEADTAGRGKIVGGSLESSTVDIAKEFTNLIQYQRGYQANSRVIQAADTLSQETVNMVR